MSSDKMGDKMEQQRVDDIKHNIRLGWSMILLGIGLAMIMYVVLECL